MKHTKNNESLEKNTALDVSMVELLTDLFENSIVFNRILGLKITEIRTDACAATLAMRDDLIGHSAYRRIHGGVISASLDAMGGLVVMAALAEKYAHQTITERMQHYKKLATIDMRVDYIGAGIGESFGIQARILRLGSKIARTQMQFLSSSQEVLALANAVYIVS